MGRNDRESRQSSKTGCADVFGGNASDPSIGPNYIVMQYEADNPGVWPLDCHLAWHLATGMMAIIVERPDDL